MKRYSELENRTLVEAKNDLRRLNDPTCLSYNDNYYAKSLQNKYGMTTLMLAKLIRDLKLNECYDEIEKVKEDYETQYV